MVIKQNERGVTLIEVLVSIVILSLILGSFMTIFPQMGFMNKQNQDKIQGISSAKQILIEWQHSPELKAFLLNPSVGLPEYTSEDANYYYFKTTEASYTANFKVKKVSDLKTGPSKALYIQVQVLNSRGNTVSETYGYIILK